MFENIINQTLEDDGLHTSLLSLLICQILLLIYEHFLGAKKQ